MRGYYALRKGGWDTHGLPVELAIEKELGFKHKSEIEEYGIAAFNEKCRASVLRNIGAWERFTERMAYWTDLDNAYVTFTDDYIECVVGAEAVVGQRPAVQRAEGRAILRALRHAAEQPRGGAGLPGRARPQRVRAFPLRDKPGVYFLVWTTTPWTLPANVALAVGEDIDYVQVEGPVHSGGEHEGTEQLILAAALVEKVLIHPEEYKVVKRFKGKDLVGMQYNPLYTFLPVEEKYAYVVSADFASADDGTGIVHIAPAFGVDDMAVAQKNKLPVLQTINSEGAFIDAVTDFRGCG